MIKQLTNTPHTCYCTFRWWLYNAGAVHLPQEFPGFKWSFIVQTVARHWAFGHLMPQYNAGLCPAIATACIARNEDEAVVAKFSHAHWEAALALLPSSSTGDNWPTLWRHNGCRHGTKLVPVLCQLIVYQFTNRLCYISVSVTYVTTGWISKSPVLQCDRPHIWLAGWQAKITNIAKMLHIK